MVILLEYGKTFKNARWARVYVEGYHWNQDRQADKNGLRIGSEDATYAACICTYGIQ